MFLASSIIGLLITYAAIFLLLYGVHLLHKRGLPATATRSIIQIGVTNWWFMARIFLTSPICALIGPLSFVLITFLLYKYNLIRAIEHPEKRKNLGIIYFPAVTAVITLAAYIDFIPMAAATTGILILGWSDGLASLIGQHLPASRPGIRAFFRRTFSTPAGNKTLGGTSALFFSAVAIVILVLRIDTQMAWQHILLSAMLVAGTVTAAELGTPRGFDNITVALFSTATTWWLMLRFNPNMPDAASSADLPAGILAFIFVGAVAFAFLLWRIRATTRRGALISGFFTIVTAMSAGWPVSLVVVACQVADGLIAHRRRASTRAAIATGIPAVLALWYSASGNIILLWAIAAAVCASATDSIAGSLGKKFGGTVYQLPFFRPVPAGRGGGVSLAGTLFAIVTAAIGGLLAHFLVPQTSWQVAGIIAGSALFGSLLDSFLGATIQAEYRDLHTGELTSTPGSHNPLVRGIHHIRPDVIDFLSSTGAVAFCFLLCWFFVQSPSLLH